MPDEKRCSAQDEQTQRWLVSGDPILEAEARSRSSTSVIKLEMPAAEFTLERTPEVLSECDRDEASSAQLNFLDLSNVIAGIDCERVRLQWKPQELQQYCLDQYGRLRVSLHDDELISLLLVLQQLK